MPMTDYRQWRHVFKLDPARTISDADLERVCRSGTDAVMVGGSTEVTYENVEDLLVRLRRFGADCVLEISEARAVVPGYDLYLVPIVLNAGDPQWIVGRQHQAIDLYGDVIEWQRVVAEGYVIMNPDCTAAVLTGARADVDAEALKAYARLSERLFRFPIFYVEYSGVYGQTDMLRTAAMSVGTARLFYGGGVDGAQKAFQAARYAHTVVVGNAVYECLEQALETVAAVKSVPHEPYRGESFSTKRY